MNSSNIEMTAAVSVPKLVLPPLLAAAREGNAKKLKELLQETNQDYKELISGSGFDADGSPAPKYPEYYKYTLKDLLEKDGEGRTALHLGAAVANQKMSLDTVQILLDSKQVWLSETVITKDGKSSVVDGVDKLTKLVNFRDQRKEIPIIRAIENEAPEVVSLLLANNSDLLAKDIHGMEVLKLIFRKVPNALKTNFDDSITLKDDHKGFSLNWGAIIGKRRDVGGKGPKSWKETEFLSYILTPRNTAVEILRHPLVKLFLHLKWNKIKWVFLASLVFHLIWLGLYAAAFVLLQSSVGDPDSDSDPNSDSDSDPISSTGKHGAKNNSLMENSTVVRVDDALPGGHYAVCIILLGLTVLVGIKQIYQLFVLRWAYFTIENLAQLSFIILYVTQFGLLLAQDTQTAATISIIGVVLMTVLVMFQCGKIPYFGVQVAAIKRVVATCSPHFPLLAIWFTGFGLVFWALFYKNSSALAIPAQVAAMATGELNASEMLEKVLGGTASFRDFVCVLCFLFFIVFVVTLHFNLLIGYAVSDIQVLIKEAEALELYNRLSTIYTIESFLLAMASILGRRGGFPFVYILSPYQFKKHDGLGNISFQEIPKNLLKECQDIAFQNLRTNK